jgi:hypothetical protein
VHGASQRCLLLGVVVAAAARMHQPWQDWLGVCQLCGSAVSGAVLCKVRRDRQVEAPTCQTAATFWRGNSGPDPSGR